MLYKKFSNGVNENIILENKQSVIIACSGGADSLCLLHLMQRLAKQKQLSVIVCHVNHNLRANESEQDAQLVQEYCHKNNLVFELRQVDVHKLMQRENLSVEMAARILRYKALREVKQQYAATIILTAHTRNDQAETFFLNMLRGAGLSGLKGILLKNQDVVRPLLDFSRSQIEAYCKQHALDYCKDSSNNELKYLRNSVRKELIPYIESKYNRKIIDVVTRNMKALQRDEAYLWQQVVPVFEKIIFQNKNAFINRRELENLHQAIFSRLILQTIEKIQGHKQGISNVHLQDVFHLIQRQATGKKIELPGQLFASLEYENLVLRSAKEEKEPFVEQEISIQQPGIYDFCGKRFSVTVQKKATENDQLNILCIPMLTTLDNLKIRNRRAGDVVQITNVGKQKLKEFFINQKTDRTKRDLIPLVEYNGQIIWVVGYRKFINDFPDNAGKNQYIIIECMQ